ncbi:unnamed protein product [Phytomonas sp. Hart1]|nr:unnamed protein product [Phytomonas sp. Hart1]|eukprot:CCW67210.1 unnamed protein product [Phytomonas sp. isolate Hart1]
MLGGSHFKKKIEKKERKKEARKASRSENNHHPKKHVTSSSSAVISSDGGKSAYKNTNKSVLKGPVVSYGEGPSVTGVRDSANNRRNVPFRNKFEERQYRKKHPQPNPAHAGRDGAGGNANRPTRASDPKRARGEAGGARPPQGSTPTNGSASARKGSANASSAAQRRRVIRHKADDDLLDHFRQQLNASTFRLLNEQIYGAPTAFAGQLLRDSETFRDYHTGYRQQLAQWPINPNHLILEALLGDRRGRFLLNRGKCMPGTIPSSWVVADMGCGEAELAAKLQTKGYTVHSFDFCALNEMVTIADTTKVPLASNSVDVCVFSLSLMATDYENNLFEAFRILKSNRLLKVVEVRSRIPSAKRFAEMVESIGFTLDFQDVVGDYFVAFDFLKGNQEEANQNLSHIPSEVLLPSLYKKR